MSIDIYQTVTDRIVASLEAGTAPWRQPWKAGKAGDNGPRNIEGHVYRGINVFLLLLTQMEKGYSSPFWMTFKQAKARGGKVKKGEHGTLVVFWKRIVVTEDNNGKPEKKVVPLLRYYYVFNVDQTEGVKLPKRVTEQPEAEEAVEHTPVEAAEAVLAGYPNAPVVSENGTQAFYVPATDRITVPPRSSFESIDEFYSTLFHELGHSTGHESRLHRSVKNGFGTHDYGREELVAEMTSAFLCAETGIESTLDNSAAYLQSWIRTIKEDTKAVVVAAGQAQRAVDHILDRKFQEDNGEASAA